MVPTISPPLSDNGMFGNAADGSPRSSGTALSGSPGGSPLNRTPSVPLNGSPSSSPLEEAGKQEKLIQKQKTIEKLKSFNIDPYTGSKKLTAIGHGGFKKEHGSNSTTTTNNPQQRADSPKENKEGSPKITKSSFFSW